MPNIRDIFLKTNPRVLGQRLQAARKAVGLTQEEAATRLGIARTTLLSLEQGGRLPTPQELYEMSKLYGVQPFVVLRQQPPPEPLTLQFRRTPRVADKDDALIRDRLKELQDFCDDYLELEAMSRRTAPRIQAPVYPFDEKYARQAGYDVAQAERNRLGLGDAPIVNLLETIENEGIAIFQLKLPSLVAGIYVNVVHHNDALPGDTIERPCIIVNSNHPPVRRRLTIAHEYGHFGTRRNTAQPILDMLPDEERTQERFADAFAHAFLMPATSVGRRFREMQQDRGKFLPSDLVRLAHYFFVSAPAMAYRLEELELSKPGRFQILINAGFNAQEAQEALGLAENAMDNRMLPLRYQLLASEAYHHHTISEEEYARFMRLDILGVRKHDRRLRTELNVNTQGELQPQEVQLTDETGA